MTPWYWQNQQLAHLNRWEREGLINHCRIKSLKSIRPLFLQPEKQDGARSGSRLVVSVTTCMEDYLAERGTGKVVEGSKGFADTEHIWSFELRGKQWVVANIEDGSLSLTYAQMVPKPATESAAPGETGAREA